MIMCFTLVWVKVPLTISYINYLLKEEIPFKITWCVFNVSFYCCVDRWKLEDEDFKWSFKTQWLFS